MPCFGGVEADSVQFAPHAWEPVWQLMGGYGTKHGECPGASSVMSPAPCAVPAFWCRKHHLEILQEKLAGCKSGILPTANQLELGVELRK